MRALLAQTLPAAMRLFRKVLRGLAALVLLYYLGQMVSAQCVDHPDRRTALVFNNESSHDLTFFVDDEEKTFVRSREVSNEWEVEPGDHLLRARAIVRGKSFWVATVNEVPKGQVCTWTINDPSRRPHAVINLYRSVLDPRSKVRFAPGNRQR